MKNEKYPKILISYEHCLGPVSLMYGVHAINTPALQGWDKTDSDIVPDSQ